MPWFRQSSFGLGLNKLRLPKQHTIASSNSDVPAEYDPENESARARAASSTELLRRKVRKPSLHYEKKDDSIPIYGIYAVSCKIMRKMRPHICSEN